MKKISLVIIAIALILGMTNCKKEVDTVAQNNNGKKVHITLKVNNGSKGVDPTTGEVTYDDGNTIYVGTEDHECGYLYYDDLEGVFSGDIEPVEGEYLYFYYMGSALYDYDYDEGEYIFDISDQESELPVLSCGRSNVKYDSEVTSYSCTMYNQCALVNFTLENEAHYDVILNDVMNSKLTIDFATHEIRESTLEYGDQITLYSESETSKWAILLPMSEKDATITIDGYDYYVTIPDIEANDYLTGENAIEIGDPVPVPVPAYVYCEFSVSSTKTVHFSPGNLQYKAGEGWRFAERQYDAIGSWNTSDWVDLFGWGTWGSGKNPLNESEDWEDYQWSTDFEGTLDGYNDWFTLSKEEWQYILDHSTNGWSTVAGFGGFVIRPDGNTTAVASSYSAQEWAVEEALGSVFLPAAGEHVGSNFLFNYDDPYGYYWSSTPSSTEGHAWFLSADGSLTSMDDWWECYEGFSVRLVRPN